MAQKDVGNGMTTNLPASQAVRLAAVEGTAERDGHGMAAWSIEAARSPCRTVLDPLAHPPVLVGQARWSSAQTATASGSGWVVWELM
jgi:hypothetical protein